MQILELRSNQIVEIPAEIAQMTSLNKLDVSHNKIQALPYEMHKMSNLTTLDVSDNPLLGVPNSVIQGGVTAIRAFLKQRGAKK